MCLKCSKMLEGCCSLSSYTTPLATTGSCSIPIEPYSRLRAASENCHEAAEHIHYPPPPKSSTSCSVTQNAPPLSFTHPPTHAQNANAVQTAPPSSQQPLQTPALLDTQAWPSTRRPTMPPQPRSPPPPIPDTQMLLEGLREYCWPTRVGFMDGIGKTEASQH